MFESNNIRNLVNEYIRSYPELYEDEELYESVVDFARELLEEFKNFVETAKVIEEQKEATCFRHYNKYNDNYYYVCSACLEDITSPYDCEEFKFCPYCGAQFKEIKNGD